jgi:hypothetical protein
MSMSLPLPRGLPSPRRPRRRRAACAVPQPTRRDLCDVANVPTRPHTEPKRQRQPRAYQELMSYQLTEVDHGVSDRMSP